MYRSVPMVSARTQVVRQLRLLVAVLLVAGTSTITIRGAGAAGFTPASQVQTPVASLNQRSVLIGQKDGGTAALVAPAGATVVSARLSFGAADTGAAAVTPLDRQTVSLTVPPAAAVPIVAPAASLLTDGGGYRHVADVTANILPTTASVTVSGIEGTGASWALLVIYNVTLPAGQRSQVTYLEGFTKVTNGPDTVTFGSLVPANPATSGALRVGAAAGGPGPATEGVAFDPDVAGQAAAVAVGSGNSFDAAAGNVALNATVTPAPGATSASATFDPPNGAGGDSYFVMVVAYEVTFSVAELTLTQTLSDASPGSTPPPDTFAGDVVGVAVSVANTPGRSAASGAIYTTNLPAGTTLTGGKVYTDSTTNNELPAARFNLTGSTLTVGVGGDLPAGGVVAGTPVGFYYELTTSRANAPSLAVSGSVAYNDQASGAAQPAAANTTPAFALPVSNDLSPTLTVPATSEAGTPFNASATVANAGPSDLAAGEATITISIGAGLALSGPVPSGCSSTATSVTCPVPAIAKGATSPASPNVMIIGTNPPGTRTVTATVNVTPAGQDPVANNSDPKTVRVRTTPGFTIVASPAEKRVPVYPGDPTTSFDVVYNLKSDINAEIDDVVVTVPTPVLPADAVMRGLTATEATTTGPAGTCNITPPGPAQTTTCTFATFPKSTSGTVTITYSISGNMPAPPAAPINIDFVAAATASPNTPVMASAAAKVSIEEANADLEVEVEAITYVNPFPGGTGSNLQVGVSPTGTFDAQITIRNLGPDIALAPTVTFVPGPNTEVLASASCTGNVCSIGSLASGGVRVLTVSFRLTATADAVHARSAPFTLGATTVDPVSTNDTGTVTGTINRSPVAQPDTGPASGPAVPSGGTLIYKTFANGDADPDTDVITLTANGTPVLTPNDGSASVGVVRNVNGTLTVTPTLTPDTDPAVDRVVKISIPVTIDDSNGATAPSALELAVTDAFTRTVEGSFGTPPAAAESFGVAVDPALLGDSVNSLDVLGGERGKNAQGDVFLSTPGPGATTYVLTLVDQSTINVSGSTATLVNETPGNPRKVVSYIPARGFTSDPPNRPGTDLADAPPDGFGYTATGTKDGVEIFTVASKTSIEVRNQLPIGVDSLDEIFTAAPSGLVLPAGNDVDGNTVADPIAVSGGSFVFDDEGKKDAAKHGLQILCIGPVPTLDPVTGQPPTPGANVCTEPGMKMPDQTLEVPAPVNIDTGKSPGKIKATLVGTPGAGVTPFKTVKVTLDDTDDPAKPNVTVVGIVPFAAVVVDNYGGSAWSLENISIPNQPPEVIPGVQKVPKNSPPVKVLDTTLPGVARDNNGDLVKVSSVSDPEHGTATITSDAFGITYKPDADYVGPDSLVLNVSDNRGVGSNSAQLTIDVFEELTPLAPGSVGGAGAGGASPAGSLAATGGDPLPLTAAASFSMLLGFGLVQASRRRRSRPLLDRARHLRA